MRIALISAMFLIPTMANAWGDMDMTQPNDPNGPGYVEPVHTHNFCPAGLQPVNVGGVICCGVPNG